MAARSSVYAGGMFAQSQDMTFDSDIPDKRALGVGLTRQLSVPVGLNVAGIRTQTIVSKTPRRTAENMTANNGGPGWDFMRARSYQITGVPTTPPPVENSKWQPWSIPLMGNAILTGWAWPARWSGVWGFGGAPVPGQVAPGGTKMQSRPRWTKVFAPKRYSTLPDVYYGGNF